MYKKVFSAAILASAAMAMTSCSSSKNAQNENATKAEKITEAEAARPSADEEWARVILSSQRLSRTS